MSEVPLYTLVGRQGYLAHKKRLQGYLAEVNPHPRRRRERRSRDGGRGAWGGSRRHVGYAPLHPEPCTPNPEPCTLKLHP